MDEGERVIGDGSGERRADAGIRRIMIGLGENEKRQVHSRVEGVHVM
jgi:hypothetical protein